MSSPQCFDHCAFSTVRWQIDGWFFAVVTIATVGYGVLTPTHDGMKLVVVTDLIQHPLVYPHQNCRRSCT